MARRQTSSRTDDFNRRADLIGIGLVALSAVLLIALAMNNGGLLGDSLAGFFRLMVGQGAWVIPLVLFVSGLALIFGNARFQLTRVTWGGLLMFAGVIAGIARPDATGDYFIDTAMQSSGGYLGALIGWALSGLLGGAKGVAIFALVFTGAVLCFDQPIRELLVKMVPGRREEEGVKTVTAKARKVLTESDEELPARAEVLTKEDARAARREATMKMLEASADREDEAAKPKPRAVITGGPSKSEITLDSKSNEPKDGYVLPPLNLLADPPERKKRDPKEVQKNIEILEETLEQFNIESNVVEVANGPTITRYEIQLGAGIRVSRITNLADNIALSLAASHVRVEAPIPGKSAIGIEIPTAQRQMVTLREMVDSLEFHDAQNKLTIALGKDVAGVATYTDLTRMPHLLVGGATNSGKSICLATLIMSLILRLTPKDLRLVMIDPKRVELTLFERLPHLLCPVVKDVKEAAGVLRAVVREMDRRYDMFSEASVRNIDGWNAKANFQERLPYIVVIVDELADLMIQCRNEVETSICRLAQLARATGIHLVIATQRPSVDVITGTIKNNISSRIAFAVSSGIDSRTIIDGVGAEDLIGKGDMLFMPIDANKPVRIQGCYVSEKEIEQVCNFWREQEKPSYLINPVEVAIQDKESQMRDSGESDELWADAVRFVVEKGSASTSMLQRRFSIGFQRASRLLDMMEERGVVGPRDGPRPREILVDPMAAESLLGNTQYDTPMPDGAYLDDD